MAVRQSSWTGKLGLGLVFVVATSRVAAATLDMTGRWLITTRETFGQDKAAIWDIVQTGTSVTYTSPTTTETGAIDLASAVVSFPPPPPFPPFIPCNVNSGLTLQIAADGESFTGSASFATTDFDVNGNLVCIYDIVTFTGGRCSDSGGTGSCVMLSGGGRTATDCLHEWITPQGATLTSKGRQYPRLTCTLGDPTCDFHQSLNACTFYVGMCFNVADSALPCTTQGVSEVRFIGRGTPQLTQALAQMGGQVQGVCQYHAAPCSKDSDCDSARGKGICQPVVTFPPALSAGQVCTALQPISVPVGGLRTRRTLTVRTKSTTVRANGTHPLDDDRLTLICQ